MANKTSSKKGQGTAPKKVGRPTKLTPELGDELCELIALGSSTRQAAAALKIEMKTIFRWLRTNEEFRQQYTHAKNEELPESMQDKIHDIADGTLSGHYDPNAARVAIDAYKWTAMKLKPKKYGDKLDMTSDGKALPQPILAMLTTQATENDRKVVTNEIENEVENVSGPQIETPKQLGNIMDDINK